MKKKEVLANGLLIGLVIGGSLAFYEIFVNHKVFFKSIFLYGVAITSGLVFPLIFLTLIRTYKIVGGWGCLFKLKFRESLTDFILPILGGIFLGILIGRAVIVSISVVCDPVISNFIFTSHSPLALLAVGQDEFKTFLSNIDKNLGLLSRLY